MELEEYKKKSEEIKSHPNYKEPIGLSTIRRNFVDEEIPSFNQFIIF